MADSDTQQMVSLHCGGRTFRCSKDLLASRCQYFNALYSSNFADSSNMEHTFSSDLMNIYGLRHVIHFARTGKMILDRSLAQLIEIDKAAAMLQALQYEEAIGEAAWSKVLPELCISQAKLLNFQSSGSIDLRNKCFSFLSWKFYELLDSSDLLELTAPELYWLLRNPKLVDPSGGVMALLMVDRWVTEHLNRRRKQRQGGAQEQHGVEEDDWAVDLDDGFVCQDDDASSAGRRDDDGGACSAQGLQGEGSSLQQGGGEQGILQPTQEHPASNGGGDAAAGDAAAGDAAAGYAAGSDAAADEDEERRSLCAMLTFAVVEGLEERMEGDAPAGYTRLAVLPSSPSSPPSGPPRSPAPAPAGANPPLSSWTAASGAVGPLPLTVRDVQVIRQWRETNVVFRDLYEVQNKVPWLPCVVGDTDDVPSVLSFDPVTGRLERVTSLPTIMRGAKMTARGSQLLLFGGEEKLGRNSFQKEVHFYDWFTRQWVTTELDAPLLRRGSLHCWRNGERLLLVGGYERHRIKARQTLQLSQHLCDDSLRELLSQRKAAGGAVSRANLKDVFRVTELFGLPEWADPKLGALTSAAEHVLLFTGRMLTLAKFCLHEDRWVSRRMELVDGPAYGFQAAIPYGTGVYLNARLSADVYWMPLFLKHGRGFRDPPKVRLFKYGSFPRETRNVCRVQDQLYGFSQDSTTDLPSVAVLPLLYNPLESLNILSKVTSLAGEQQTPTAAEAVLDDGSPAEGVCPAASSTSSSNREMSGTGSQPAEVIVIPNILPPRSALVRSIALQHKKINQNIRETFAAASSSESSGTVVLAFAKSLLADWNTDFCLWNSLQKGNEDVFTNRFPLRECLCSLRGEEHSPPPTLSSVTLQPVLARTVYSSRPDCPVRLQSDRDPLGSDVGCFAVFHPLAVSPQPPVGHKHEAIVAEVQQ